MFLKRIELQGFKSFADKTVIQFDHDITGIVGPNGCGKSNINDAIRWVLGEQSIKSLRSGSSMSDIIFSGSEYRKPVNLAKVSLVFDNTQHIFDSDFDEIEITRQLERANNEASYFINKTPCRLKDINDLVMDTGLGRDSLSIITQGNISAFADAKPEDRRSLFEEAAGVAKYKKRKQVSLRKLEKTKDNLDRVQDIMDEIEHQLVPLKRQADKAQKYLSYRDSLSKIEINVLVHEIGSYHEQLQELKTQIDMKRSDLISYDTQLTNLDTEIEAARKQMYQLDATIHTLQGEYTQAMNQSVQLEKRKIELDEKRKYALSQADQEERKHQLEQILAEARYEYEDRKSRLEAMQTQYDLLLKKQEQTRQDLYRCTSQREQANRMYQQLDNRQQIVSNMLAQPYQHQAGVRAIVAAKSSLSGIEGVISELLVAKDQMGQAIQAALGGTQYQIVTDNEVSARAAIGFLKRNRSGRATFLPMTVCRPRPLNQQQQFIATSCEGFIDFANGCVQCDPRYEMVRDSLLGHVIVMDTLEHANECAKRLNHRVKIVTLDGEIVHPGGSMTGGRGKNQSSPVTLKQEMTTITKKLTEAKANLDALIQKENKYKQADDDYTNSIVDLKVSIGKLENVYEVKKQKYASLKDEYGQLGDLEENATSGLEDELVIEMSKMHAHIDSLTEQMQAQRQRRYQIGQQVEEKENDVRKIRRLMNALQSEIHQLDVDQTKKQTQMDNDLMRLNTDYQMTYEYAKSQYEDLSMDIEQAKDEVVCLRQKIKSLGNVNLDAPQEYAELSERFTFMSKQKEDLENASQQILDAIAEMDQTVIEKFTDMFHKINNELDDVFKALFGGGHAKLTMVDPDDVLHTGIDIDVQPPGKMVKNIQTFSGGEKALIAISVLFSILRARTMPLCIFDEVEAALDQANVERFAKYLDRFRGQSQFIVVTHRPGTMEQCDTLYGVTMQKDGVSQLLKVELRDAVHIVEKEEEEENGNLSINQR